MPLKNCKIINLSKHNDRRGSLIFLESKNHIHFSFERIYYLYDLKPGTKRGKHAHKKLEQLMIAISGSFDISLDDGRKKKVFHLSKPSEALYICPMMWRELYNFSSNSVALVLASYKYDEGDYIRNYDDFIESMEMK